MRLFSSVLLGLGLLLAAQASDLTPHTNCGFTGALQGIQLGDCREWPCAIQRGVPIKAEVLFKALLTYKKLETTMMALYGGIGIPLYHDEEMCDRMVVGGCPWTAGDNMRYLTNVTVPSHLPPIDVTLEWIILRSDGKTVVCAQVPAQFY